MKLKLSKVLAGGALIAACVLVVALSLKVRTLTELNRELWRLSRDLLPGQFVPTFHGRTLTGDTVIIGETQGGAFQLLFVFRTTCPYCRASVPSWRRIAEEARRRRDAEVYGVAVDSVHLVRSFVHEHQLDFPVLRFPDRKTEALYRVRGFPTTVVLNPEGRVVYVRLGVVETQTVVDSILSAIWTVPSPGEPGTWMGPLSTEGSPIIGTDPTAQPPSGKPSEPSIPRKKEAPHVQLHPTPPERRSHPGGRSQPRLRSVSGARLNPRM